MPVTGGMIGMISALTVVSSSDSEDEAEGGEIHRGVVCDSCERNPLIGERYKCEVCPDYDLCGKCKGDSLPMATSGVPHNAEHSMRRIMIAKRRISRSKMRVDATDDGGGGGEPQPSTSQQQPQKQPKNSEKQIPEGMIVWDYKDYIRRLNRQEGAAAEAEVEIPSVATDTGGQEPSEGQGQNQSDPRAAQSVRMKDPQLRPRADSNPQYEVGLGKVLQGDPSDQQLYLACV